MQLLEIDQFLQPIKTLHGKLCSCTKISKIILIKVLGEGIIVVPIKILYIILRYMQEKGKDNGRKLLKKAIVQPQ